MEIAIRDDAGRNVFRPGSSVEGKVFFLDKEKLKIFSLSVKLVRRFIVDNSILKRGAGGAGNAVLKEETIVGQDITIQDQSFLEPGVPFAISIRKDLRRSHSSKAVSLKYAIVATAIARKSVLGNVITTEVILTKECNISVYAPICAADFAGHTKPLRTSETRQFKKDFFFKDGELKGTSVIGKTVFSFGENIPVMITAQNSTSGVRVSKITMTLNEVTTFSGKHKFVLDTQVIKMSETYNLIDENGLLPHAACTIKGDIMVPPQNGIFHPTLVESPGVDFCVNHYLVVSFFDDLDKPLLAIQSCIAIIDVYKDLPATSISMQQEQEQEQVPPPRPPKSPNQRAPQLNQNIQNNNNNNNNVDDDDGVNNNNNNEDKGLCVVCLAEPQTHVIVPCGHKCLCESCAPAIQKMNKCPICQSPLQTIIKVFET